MKLRFKEEITFSYFVLSLCEATSDESGRPHNEQEDEEEDKIVLLSERFWRDEQRSLSEVTVTTELRSICATMTTG